MIKAIIFDYGYTIYDPDLNGFQPDVTSTLELLLKKYKLILVSRTKDVEERLKQIEKLGFNLYFDYIDVIEKGGIKDFSKIVQRYNLKGEEFLVIGDRITSELTEGKRLGMKTCRILYGPEKNLIPQNEFETPDFTIERLSEIPALVESIE